MMDSDDDGCDPMDLIGFGDVMDPSNMLNKMLEEDDDDNLNSWKRTVWWDDESDLIFLIEHERNPTGDGKKPRKPRGPQRE